LALRKTAQTALPQFHGTVVGGKPRFLPMTRWVVLRASEDFSCAIEGPEVNESSMCSWSPGAVGATGQSRLDGAADCIISLYLRPQKRFVVVRNIVSESNSFSTNLWRHDGGGKNLGANAARRRAPRFRRASRYHFLPPDCLASNWAIRPMRITSCAAQTVVFSPIARKCPLGMAVAQAGRTS
jgi:hypothetical protein